MIRWGHRLSMNRKVPSNILQCKLQYCQTSRSISYLQDIWATLTVSETITKPGTTTTTLELTNQWKATRAITIWLGFNLLQWGNRKMDRSNLSKSSWVAPSNSHRYRLAWSQVQRLRLLMLWKSVVESQRVCKRAQSCTFWTVGKQAKGLLAKQRVLVFPRLGTSKFHSQWNLQLEPKNVFDHMIFEN